MLVNSTGYASVERRASSVQSDCRKPKVIRYEPMRPDDGALRQRLHELAVKRRRLGYLLVRECLARIFAVT